MGSVGQRAKRALMICGDYMEDYEAMVPFQVLQAVGVRVDAVSPNKKTGQKCVTAVHEYMGYEIYTELEGHFFTLNASFSDANLEDYDALIIPGGRFTEVICVDDDVVNMVTRFAGLGRPILTTCHSQLVLVSAGLISGKRCTAFPSLKHVVKLAGGAWVEPDPVTTAVADGNVITAIGWPAHNEILSQLLGSMGARITGAHGKSVLFVCGDYTEDYEINVVFRAFGGLGCRVDAISPGKSAGEKCVTCIQDFGIKGSEICSEQKVGHYFIITNDVERMKVADYDCIVIPGGRAPEYLAVDERVVSLVKQFSEENKIVSAIGEGQLVLAAAGLLKGKKCASSGGMRVVVGLAGGEADETSESVAHGKMVTAKGWNSLPNFISDLASVLGITVTF
ncbi:protein DJ-1 homolog D-like [Nymphaea colorata]|nr:protein DJ-1 homolog D-like [Nymphaea colorata]